MRSFGLVEDKIYETDFFLEKIKFAYGIYECRYYLSAFLSACRSITFVLQACMKGVGGFDIWYNSKQIEMSNNPLAKFFLKARNESEKIGLSHLWAGKAINENGNQRMLFYFDTDYTIKDMIFSFVNENTALDIYSQCLEQFVFILTIIYDCFNEFGAVIDPKKYYTIDNLQNLGITIEDIEEMLGLPRGWTDIEGYASSVRLDSLRNSQPDSKMDFIFEKYLHKKRYQD